MCDRGGRAGELQRSEQETPVAEVYPVDEDGGVVPDVAESAELQADLEEEVDRAKPLTTPWQPTQSEYDDHKVSHTPYRPWCRHCVEGRGREAGHVTKPKDPRAVPVIHFDYKGLSDLGEVEGLNFKDGDESATKVLVVRDGKGKILNGHVVPQKGVDSERFSVDCLVQDILWCGYTKVILKSDNEKAILKLLVESLRDLRVAGEFDQVMSENSPEYDPQSNGGAEVGVKLWYGMFRTQRSSLEENIGAHIPVKHPITPWLVKWSGDVLNWTVRGEDGQTPYQRVRGKTFTTRLVCFGECVRYKLRSHEPLANSPDGKRTHLGIFLGVDRKTGQYILFGDHGVKLARTIFRVPNNCKWDRDKLQSVNITPYNMYTPPAPEIVFREDAKARPEELADNTVVARDVYLKPADFAKFGLSRGCARCDHELNYGPGRTSKPHSARCRSRIVAELAKDPEGRARIARAAERMDRTVWEMSRAQAQGENVDVVPSTEIAPGQPGSSSDIASDVAQPSAAEPPPAFLDMPADESNLHDEMGAAPEVENLDPAVFLHPLFARSLRE